MLNQVFSMIFGNSESDLHSKATRQAPSSSDSKKRSAAELEECLAMSGQTVASDSDISPTKKRGRPPLKKNLTSNLKKKVVKGGKRHDSDRESDQESNSDHSSHTDIDKGNKRVRSTRSTLVMPSNTSDYDGSEEDSEEEEAPVATVRRSSRSAVLKATQQTPAPVQRSSSETSAFSSYMSSALMRRSRRSRTVDLTKPLVVMLPGDDPREVAQLDLRGDVEWEEFLLAMSEDTTFMTSDNEDGPSEHSHLPHSSSVLSLSGLVGSADGPPSRSRNSSCTFNFASPLAGPSTKSSASSGAAMKKVALDEKQVQYNEVMSVNVAATLSEVFVPEVKESELYQVITAINLLNDGNKPSSSTSLPSTASASNATNKVRTRARDGGLHELAQQALIDKRCGGYDEAHVFIMPEHLRHTSEMYVDYDADSDDEQFVRDLQIKLNRPRTPRHSTTSPAIGKKTPAADVNKPISDAEVVLKVRCLELMIARLEREFELARQFSAEPVGAGSSASTTVTTAKNKTKAKESATKDTSGSATNLAARQTIVAQLAATLEQAQVSYELAKRFLKQPQTAPSTRKASKSPPAKGGKGADKRSPGEKIASSAPAARFTRHGLTTSAPPVIASSDRTTSCFNQYNFAPLEKLHRLGLQRQSLPTINSSANLQDLATVAANSLVRANSVTEEATAPKRVGRPPLLPRIPHSQIRSETKPPTASHLQKDAPEESDEPFEEYYSAEQIASLLPESCTVQLLQAIVRTFYAQYTETSESGTDPSSTVKNKSKVGRPPKSRSNSITESENESILAQASVFGVEKELIIAHEVYQYWQRKRASVSTSLIRAYHRYIMDLWERADTVSLPVPGDYLTGSLIESRQHLIQVRRSLDRARLITDRVRRRERLKRDILRLSGEQLDALRAELSFSLPSVNSDHHDSQESEPLRTDKSSASSTSFLQPVPLAGSNLNGPVATAGQGRDRTGKFLTAQKSMARFGLHPTPKTSTNVKKSIATSSSSGSLTGGKSNANAKSVRSQEILFSIGPCSDEEDVAETDAGDESDDPFSDCISDSDSEIEGSVQAVGSMTSLEASSGSAAVKVEHLSTPAAKTAASSPGLSTNNSKSSKSSRSSRALPTSPSTSPDVKTESANSKLGTEKDRKSVGKKISAVANNNTPKKRRRSAIVDSDEEDSGLEDFDRSERLSVRGVRSQQTLQQSQHSTPSSTETRHPRTSHSGSVVSTTPAPTARHQSSSSSANKSTAQAQSAKKTPTSSHVDSNAKKGSRTRNSVPDCSLRHLPYSASKTPAQSSSKKRRL